MNEWQLKHQYFEKSWWNTCQNTFWEETKQQVYAKRMGLVADMSDGKYPTYDMKGASVIDIGGGPVSLLLKCINLKPLDSTNAKQALIVDPCDYPEWVNARYLEAGLGYTKQKAEDLVPDSYEVFDQALIYNVLQHTDDPRKIIENARKISRIVRIFEWIDMPPTEGHPHMLTEKGLNEWLGGVGKVEQLDESGCRGRSYYGIFKGDHYEEV